MKATKEEKIRMSNVIGGSFNGTVELLTKEIKEGLLCDLKKEGGNYINYEVICSSALKLLDNIFGGEYSFPIDIEYIYKKMNIPLYEIDLNSYMEGCNPKRVNRIIGKISIRRDIMSNEVKRRVYVDENTPPALQRYAMAHELCHYIMQIEEPMYTDEYCNMPMLAKKQEELVADAFAIFLLIPLGPFLKEFSTYVRNERASGRPPFRTSDWIEHLSAVSYVAEDYVAYGYQEIRYVLSWLYHMKDKNDYDDDRVKVLLDKKNEYLKEDYIKELFL